MYIGARSLPAALFVCAFSASGFAQGTWNFKSVATNPGADSPVMTYDSTHNVSLMCVNGSTEMETWQWNGTFWLPQLPMSKPFQRRRSAMVWDSTRQRAILFAGLQMSGTSAWRDTWEWDGSNWSLISQSTGPVTRADHAMVFDTVRQKPLLFGGYDPNGTNAIVYADTWEYVGSNNWQQRFPVTSPAPRYGHVMAYDTIRNRTVLFGGRNKTAYLGDTWEWDGSNWFQKYPVNSPSARSGAAMTYDSTRGVTVLFGGDEGAVLPRGDTWEWDGTDWQRVTPTSIPAVREDAALAFDASRGATVLFGGTNGAYQRDTWEYVPGTPASFTTFGAGCPGSRGMSYLSNAFGQAPVQGQTFTVVVNNVSPTAQIWLFFGASNTSWGQTQLPLNLPFLNAPGCSVLASGDIVIPVTNVSGTGIWSLSIPTGLPTGFTFFNQAFILDPANPAASTLSDAAAVVVGT